MEYENERFVPSSRVDFACLGKLIFDYGQETIYCRYSRFEEEVKNSIEDIKGLVSFGSE